MQQIFHCSNCGAQNYIENQFCVVCGQGFQYTCPQCNEIIDMNYKFCPGCGISFNWDTVQETDFQSDAPGITLQREVEPVIQQPVEFQQAEVEQIALQKERNR